MLYCNVTYSTFTSFTFNVLKETRLFLFIYLFYIIYLFILLLTYLVYLFFDGLFEDV